MSFSESALNDLQIRAIFYSFCYINLPENSLKVQHEIFLKVLHRVSLFSENNYGLTLIIFINNQFFGISLKQSTK